jgi:tRNA-dihydrouridine synthase
MAREHCDALASFAGERSFVRMRKHVAWYIADMPGASHVRARVNSCRDYRELDELLAEYRAHLERQARGGGQS